MSHVLFAQFDAFVVGAEVVVLLRQPEAALIDVGNFAGGVFEILLGAVIEEDADAQAVEVGDEGGQLVFGVEGGDAIQLGLDRGEPALVDGVRIYASGIVVADLLLVSAGGGVSCCGFFDDLMEGLGIELEEIRELIERRQVAGNGMQFGETAACVLIEVDARIRGLIHGGGVEAGDGGVWLGVAGGSRGLGGAVEGEDQQQTTGGGQQRIAHASPPESNPDHTRRNGG